MKPNWFAAFPVPSASWLPQLLTDLPSECRPFAPEDTHITIAFFGAMAPERAGDVQAVLSELSAPVCRVSLGQCLALPRPNKVSALSLALADGRETIADLMGRWRVPLWRAAGAKPDERPPLPHITVARPIRKYKHEGRKRAVAWAERVQVPDLSLELTSAALYTWAENRRVRQFKIVSQVPLQRL